MCKKASYHSKERAEAVLKMIGASPDKPSLYVPTSTYRCSQCGQWHLTSKNVKYFTKNRKGKK